MQIFTMTRARNAEEAALLQSSLKALSRHGAVTVADVSEPPLDDGTDCARFHRSTPGLVFQIETALRHLPRPLSPFVLYTEPDKLDFFQTHLGDFLKTPVPSGTGIVLAARDAQSFRASRRDNRPRNALPTRSQVSSLDIPATTRTDPC